MKNRVNLNYFFNRDRKTLYIVLGVLLVSVLTLTVVYAALSTTLNISGNAEVTAANWDIHFDNIQVNPASVAATTAPTISGSKTINFGVTLTKPGDFYKFSVDIVNEGSIDAMIDSVVKTPELTAEQAKYIRYEIEYTDGNSISSKQLLPKDETKAIGILVSYRNDITASDLPVAPTTLDLSFTMIYIQADTTGTVVPEGTEVKVVSGDLNTVGSEICIGEECFYLMKNDGRSVTMLSKYNLYVGGYLQNDIWTAYGDEATGIQDSTMLAFKSSETIFNGTFVFSSTKYWAEIANGYPMYVYNSNSNLYLSIVNYNDYLNGLGLNVEQVRLIKVEELLDLGCSEENESCKTSLYLWVYSTSYWTGSVSSSNDLWRVASDGRFYDYGSHLDRGYGVRPVVKIRLTEF